MMLFDLTSSTRKIQQRPRLHLTKFLELRRQRKQLARLSKEQLLDVGLTQSDANNEARKPIWDVPSYWRD